MNILFQKCKYIVCTNSYLDYKDMIILLESHLFLIQIMGFLAFHPFLVWI
jgi:hypothetical protein